MSQTDAASGGSTASRFEPPISELAVPFWAATRRRQLLLQWCMACRVPVFYPREACPRCLGDRLEWQVASGQGIVYAVTVEHRPQDPRMKARAPYAVALVDLAEGARMLTNVVGCPPDAVEPGMAVTLCWEPLSDGRMLPQFTPSLSAPRGG